MAKDIQIFICEQKLLLRNKKQIEASYPISSALQGEGFEKETFQTPLGKFRIYQKIGGNCPAYSLFQGRKWQKEKKPKPDENAILSRILWLDGLNLKNRNTYERYIYIHGASQEEKIGKKISKGCICLKNKDMIELYQKVSLLTEVNIFL